MILNKVKKWRKQQHKGDQHKIKSLSFEKINKVESGNRDWENTKEDENRQDKDVKWGETSLMVQGMRLCPLNAEGLGSTPGSGNYIPHSATKILQARLPGGPVVKNLPVHAGDTGSIPGLGRLHITEMF